MPLESHHYDGRRDEEGRPCAPAQDLRPGARGRTHGRPDRYCIDLMHQLAAVQAAIGKAGEVILRSHVETYVADAVQSDERERKRKVEELLAVFGRYSRIREQ